MRLPTGALQQQALRWVGLHRSCAKLTYICTAIFGTLMEEGFCGPQDEGEEAEGVCTCLCECVCLCQNVCVSLCVGVR